MQYGNKCKLCWKVSVYYNFLQYHCNVSSNGKKKKVCWRDNKVYISYFSESLYYLFIEDSVEFCIRNDRHTYVFFETKTEIHTLVRNFQLTTF